MQTVMVEYLHHSGIYRAGEQAAFPPDVAKHLCEKGITREIDAQPAEGEGKGEQGKGEPAKDKDPPKDGEKGGSFRDNAVTRPFSGKTR